VRRSRRRPRSGAKKVKHTQPRQHLPLDQLVSLSIAEVSERTGWPLSTVYDLINAGRLETYVLGRRRFAVAASVVRLMAEQATAPLGRMLPARGEHGRFAKATKAAAASTKAKGQAPHRIRRPVTPNKESATARTRGAPDDAVNLGPEHSRDDTYPKTP